MTTFVLIRHASHDLLAKAIAGRMPGVHLSEIGLQEAEDVARSLRQVKIAAIYSSPLERAMETAAPIARQLGLDVIRDEALNEIDCGEWTGKPFEELRNDPSWQLFNSFRSGSRAPGGESMLDAQTRITDEMLRLAKVHAGQTVALVSHGDVIKGALMHWLAVSLDFFLRLEISPASISAVDLQENRVRVLFMNYRGSIKLE